MEVREITSKAVRVVLHANAATVDEYAERSFTRISESSVRGKIETRVLSIDEAAFVIAGAQEKDARVISWFATALQTQVRLLVNSVCVIICLI